MSWIEAAESEGRNQAKLQAIKAQELAQKRKEEERLDLQLQKKMDKEIVNPITLAEFLSPYVTSVKQVMEELNHQKYHLSSLLYDYIDYPGDSIPKELEYKFSRTHTRTYSYGIHDYNEGYRDQVWGCQWKIKTKENKTLGSVYLFPQKGEYTHFGSALLMSSHYEYDWNTSRMSDEKHEIYEKWLNEPKEMNGIKTLGELTNPDPSTEATEILQGTIASWIERSLVYPNALR